MNLSVLKIVGALGGGMLLLGSLATPTPKVDTPVQPVLVPVTADVNTSITPDVPAAVNVEPVTPASISKVETKPVVPKEGVSVKKIETAPALTQPKAITDCHPSYSGCLKINAGDYDCKGGSGNGPNYTGPVSVSGSDPFDLDRDGDGTGCDR